MAYRRRYFKKRYGKRFVKRKTHKSLVRKVDKVVKYVNKHKPETKFAESYNIYNVYGVAGQVLDYTPAYQILQGTDNNSDRIGDVISPQMLELRGSITMGATGTGTYGTQVRMTVVKWAHVPPGALVPITYANGGSAPATFDTTSGDPFIYNMKSIKTSGQSSVIYDKIFNMDSGSGRIRHFHVKLKMSGIIRYLSTAAGYPTDGLYIVSFSTNELFSYTAPTIWLHQRLTYTDA